MPKVQEGAKYQKKYSEANVSAALDAISNGMSQRQAAATFGVPRQTLQFRKSEKFQDKINLGPNPILTKEEESILEEWILAGYRKGSPVRKIDIQVSVKEFLDENPRDNPFHHNLPGDGWYRAFLKRHPALTHRTPEAVTAASSVVAEKDIRGWFTYLSEKGLVDILQDPTRIFNGDETCFYLCPKNSKVVAPRGARNVYEIDTAQAKTNITVMFTFSASGQVTEPMVIYPYKRLPATIIESVPTTWGIGHSENGWMKAELFYEYIGNVLYPNLKNNNVKFPVILFVDGHSTHQTLKLSQLCTKLEIVLISLYPNATRIMQPADVAAFKPMKMGWKKAVLEFKRKNKSVTINKEKFAGILKAVIDDCGKSGTIKNGFRASGLFPWDACAIDYTKCLGAGNIETKEMQSINESESYVSYSQFRSIVGEDRIKLFQQIDSYDSQNNDEFIILYKMYKAFKKIDNGLNTPNTDENQIGDVDINNIDIIFNNNAIETSADVEDMKVSAKNATNDVEGLIIFENGHNIPELETAVGSVIEDQNEQNECKKDQNGNKEIPVEPNESNNINLSLRDYVTWPKTPERKEKKNCERLPFVLTSTQWKKIKMEKLESKKQEQERKENLKIERGLKKIEKENKQLLKRTTMKRRKTTEKGDKEKMKNQKQESSIQKELTSPECPINFLDNDSSQQICYDPSEPSTSRVNILSCVKRQIFGVKEDKNFM